MKTDKVWGIIGLGWLGQALQDQLIQNGDKCWGTHRDRFTFEKDSFPDQVCDVLFLNTPPLKTMTPGSYVKKIVTARHTKIIFISSTSVFGSDQRECSEVTDAKPRSMNGKWLVEVEKLMSKKYKSNFLSLRPGGLIGQQRHPVKYFSSDHVLSGGQNPINLIHRTDLINIIIKAVHLNKKGFLNVVAPYHPTRSDYYNEWAKMLNLPPLNFKDEATSTKKVDSIYIPKFYKEWVCEKLNFL